MVRRNKYYDLNDATLFFNQFLVILRNPLVPFLIPLVLVLWTIEKWVFSLSNWVPLAVAVWATFQYKSYQERIVVEDLNKKWKQVMLQSLPETPLEHCEWLNKLLIQVWPKFISPKLSLRFTSIVEYKSYQERIVVEDLNKKWKQVMLQSTPETPLEHCEWLNKLLMQVWPKFISPKLSLRFTSIVEKRLKDRKSSYTVEVYKSYQEPDCCGRLE